MADQTDFVRTRHKVSGAIDEATPRHIAEHEVLGKDLEIVGPNVKPYLPEMHRVSLPADATEDEKAAAVAAGFDLEEVLLPAEVVERNATVKAERARAKAPEKNGEG